MDNFQDKVGLIWDLADLLRGPYKRNEYQKVILPFTVLRRFDCVLKDTKPAVLQKYEQYRNVTGDLDDAITPVSGYDFYNTSKYDFEELLKDPTHIKENLIHYVDSFSKNVREIFDYFAIKQQIERLSKADLLFKLLKKFTESKVDLHPNVVSNQEMGYIFEELIRKFSEQSNEEAGDHFTPREVVELMTHLMFLPEDFDTDKKGIIRTVYDPACGTGGMLTGSKNYILELNPNIKVVLFGQEIQEEIYATCKADMLIKGEESDKIQGPLSTLSKDQFPFKKFDYCISNPPYGRKWELDQEAVLEEAEKGYDGRFGAGTPRINDGQLLFLQHMISKMHVDGQKSRIAVITNGSPLFTGDAGSGESNIRKWLIENDYIEAIIALPNQLFYNTPISTYVWVMSNEKNPERKDKIQLIDGTSFFKKMRKSLGNKRNELSKDHIENIVELYKNFKENEYSKIFESTEFGYTKVTVERPLQLNFKVNEERLENLYSIKAFNDLSTSKSKNPEKKEQEEAEGRRKQEKIIHALEKIGNETYKNWNTFEKKVNLALNDFKLKPAFVKSIIMALSEHDDTAEYVKDKKGVKADSNLRDNEKIPLNENIEEYFKREVLPYYNDAWMDSKKDTVGYEINFTKYFYKYSAPRDLEEIKSDISKVISDIEELLGDGL
ncbi:type I restriction-modification system subunit M [Methanococcus maripaludis]|uniref:type I restriction-modification system subunit M n=1 Tax=Methanococcus maripaludis TaxID=39152 RepID=UPI003365AD99